MPQFKPAALPRSPAAGAAPPGVAARAAAGALPWPRSPLAPPPPVDTAADPASASIVTRESAVPSVPRPAAYESTKRALDILIACLALILAAPLLLTAAAAIKLTSPGPAFFRQRRAGRDRRPFIMYKLRTMVAGADDDKELFLPLNDLAGGPCFKIRRDPRVTRVGRWLRKSSIDELPQLWNVIKGDMALVGPRPLPLDEVRGDDWHQHLRHSVRPGLTCLWQVSGRTEIPWDEWLALDLWYVRHRRLALDLAILLRTIPAVVTGRGAY